METSPVVPVVFLVSSGGISARLLIEVIRRDFDCAMTDWDYGDDLERDLAENDHSHEALPDCIVIFPDSRHSRERRLARTIRIFRRAFPQVPLLVADNEPASEYPMALRGPGVFHLNLSGDSPMLPRLVSTLQLLLNITPSVLLARQTTS